MVSLIVATDKNGVIGAGGAIPWDVPADRARFKRLTLGKWCLFGRKTWATVDRPLDGRISVVLSRKPRCVPHHNDRDGVVTWATDLNYILAHSELYGPELMVCGGGEIYRRALPFAGRIYLTEVREEYAGDVFFPSLVGWTVVHKEECEHPFSILEKPCT